VAGASGAEALRVGSVSGFALVYAGAEQGQITTSGALADEFTNTATASGTPPDNGVVSDSDTAYVFISRPSISVTTSGRRIAIPVMSIISSSLRS